jgi:hypothetical protein
VVVVGLPVELDDYALPAPEHVHLVAADALTVSPAWVAILLRRRPR